jgi:hypothetical protein
VRRLFLAVVASALVGATFIGLAAASPFVDSVTMQARSTVVRGGENSVDVFGTISSGAEGEYVAVAGKECGIPGSSFRAVGSGTTTVGGNWEGSAAIVTTTTLRAEWKSAISDTVVIRARAWVMLAKRQGAYVLSVGLAAGRLDGKRVTIQRLTPAGWKRLQTVVMKSAVERGLRFKVPKGTSIRAVLPLSQAKPCYLAGYSNIVRT